MSLEVALLLIATSALIAYAVGVWVGNKESELKNSYSSEIQHRDLKKDLSDMIALNASLSARCETLKAEKDLLSRRIDAQTKTIQELAEQKG